MAIQISSNFQLLAGLPIDTRSLLSRAGMLSANDNLFPDYFLTQCSDDNGKLYIYRKNATPNAVTGKFTALDESFGQDIQVDVLPTAGSGELGKIYQYIGETDTDYTQGYWYICKENEGAYSWEVLYTQPKVTMEVAADGDTTEGYLKTYVFKCGEEEIGKIDIPKDLFVTEGSVKKITVTKIDEEDDSTWIYTIVGTSPVETYTKADSEDEDSDYYKYPVAEVDSSFIALSIQNQTYPIFVDVKDMASGSTEAIVTEKVTSNCEIGALGVGDYIEAGASLTDVVKKLLTKYFAPTITLTATPSNKIVEIGEEIDVVLSAVVTKESEPVTSVVFYEDSTALETVTTDVANGGTFMHTVADKVNTTTTFKATATDGKKVAESKVTYTFVHPFYYGVVADKNTVDITTLTKKIEAKGKKSISYVGNNQYTVFAYDSSYGDLTSVLDKNGFENISSMTKSTDTVGGATYNIYVSNSPITTGASGFEYTFIF